MLKVLNYNKKNSLKTLEVFLNKRKILQKSQTKIVSAIIKRVKKKGDTAVFNYEKKKLLIQLIVELRSSIQNKKIFHIN